jgi:DNA-binding MarR family transcriptional regulator
MKNYRLGHRMNILSRMHSQKLLEKLISTGLTSSQWPVIAHLLFYGESTQSEISKQLAIEPPTVSKTLYNMESMGWITRVIDLNDKREKKVALTAKAKKFIPLWIKSTDDLQKQVLKDIPDEDIAVFDRVLDKLIENLKTPIK